MLNATQPGKPPAPTAATEGVGHLDWPRRPLSVLAILFALAGCESERRSAGEPDDHAGHAGHVVPAHKPRSFPDAVRRLQALDEAIGRGGAAGRPADDRTLSMAEDIAGWLPEMAAESDMPEKPWGEVDRLSAALVSEYRSLRKETGGRGDAARASGRNVAALGMILEKADPRWFDNPMGTPGPP